ncbi:MAG: bifunctional folylpolyglutamate synthase/dihydrofolate synthase [Anaerolineae bacterium]|nr:MAG: bifunctional folylpolyglutamate synthase/dihydrofolate synthase [Anaerolineae bacterium]
MKDGQMSYQESIAYLTDYVSRYHERKQAMAGHEGYGVARTEKLLASLGNPQRGFKSVLIAGTKGKGSTAAMVASILQAAGYKAGLFTQPHLHTPRERIQVNGGLIAPQDFARQVARVRPHVEERLNDTELGPVTLFEISVAMAFDFFAAQGVHFASVEVGLGGRLDATNTLCPLVSVITSISFDHTRLLGDTLAQIAYQKAGIIKQNGLVVSHPQPAEVMVVIQRICRQRNARLFTTPRHYILDPADVPLRGVYQLDNARSALTAIDCLREHGIVIPTEVASRGLRQTRWPGRLETISEDPLTVADGAHNHDSVAKLLLALGESFIYQRLTLVLGFSWDKDIESMVRILVPAADRLILTRAQHYRAADPDEIVPIAARYARDRVRVTTAPDVAAALDQARAEAGEGDLICVTGSLFVVADAREAVGLGQHEDYPSPII